MAVLFAAAMLVLPAIASAAGHITPTGVTKKTASQLVAWYDESEDGNNSIEGYAFLQVTNLSTDTGVNIHVQIFADDIFDSSDRCREHDFNDTLTPTDTVLYCFNQLDNDGDSDIECGGNNAGADIPINIRETRGFVVVTSVDSVTLPRQAISHNYLVGSMSIAIGSDADTVGLGSYNTMGRRAVDVATGADAPDGVVLDGVVNALQLLQPDLLFFGFTDAFSFSSYEENSNIVSISFSDNYSDPNGEYRAEPATAVWDPLMYDQFERATSCQQHTFTCFSDIGLNDDWNTLIDAVSADPAYTDVRLCPAVSLDETDGLDSGWVEIAVSGLAGLQNSLGVASLNKDDSSIIIRWMHAK